MLTFAIAILKKNDIILMRIFPITITLIGWNFK